MAKQIARLLKADLNETGDLKAIAKMLQSKGRGNDTILAHITQREANILKAAGGSGTINPETGLPEFYDGFDTINTDYLSSYNVGGDGGFGTSPALETATASAVPMPSIETRPLSQAEPAYVRSSADNQALYGNYGYGEAATAPGTQTAPGGEAVAGTDLFSGGFYGLTPGATTGLQPRGAVGLTATPGQAEALYRTQLPDVRPGYGITDTNVQPSAAVAPEARKPAEKSLLDKLSTDQLVRLGLAGGLGLFGAQQAKTAAKQSQAGAEEQKALGVPYQTKGAELQRAAAAGELTPAGQQSLQALQARLAQGVESRGGVGAAQAAAQLEAYRQQLLQGQYDYGIKVSQIGDSIALGAIRTGMQADQQLNQANTAFYTNLAAIAAGIPMRTA